MRFNGRTFVLAIAMNDSSMDDMNSTPLNKLPPPVLQSRDDRPSVNPPNYQELAQAVDMKSQQPLSFPQQPSPSFPPQPSYHPQSPPPPPPPSPFPHHEFVDQSMYATQSSGMQPTQMYAPSYQYNPRPNWEPGPQEAATGNVFSRFVRAQKSMLLVVAIVLVVLIFVGPRLARMSRFATIDGRLNLLGNIVASVVAGGAFKLASMAV